MRAAPTLAGATIIRAVASGLAVPLLNTMFAALAYVRSSLLYCHQHHPL